MRTFVFMHLALQYISCAIEARVEADMDVTLKYLRELPDVDRTNDTLSSSLDELQSNNNVIDDGTTEGLRLVALFLNAYCANDESSAFCMTYNRCKNKTTCDTDNFLDVNSNFIATLMSKITNIDDAHELIELTNKMHGWTKIAIIVILVALKLIISYLVERKFQLCGKLKTKIKDRRKNADFVVDDAALENDGEELKFVVPNPPAPLLVHAQPTIPLSIRDRSAITSSLYSQSTIDKNSIYDVPIIPPKPIMMPMTDETLATPPDKPRHAP